MFQSLQCDAMHPVTLKSGHGIRTESKSTFVISVSRYEETHTDSALLYDEMTAGAFLSGVEITVVGIHGSFHIQRFLTQRCVSI